MRGFKNIDELTRTECLSQLDTVNEHETVDAIRERLRFLDDEAFSRCQSKAEYQTYIKDFPEGSHLSEASEKIAALEQAEEEAAFHKCKKESDYRTYLSTYPNGRFSNAAQAYLDNKEKKHKRRKRVICSIVFFLAIIYTGFYVWYNKFTPVNYLFVERYNVFPETNSIYDEKKLDVLFNGSDVNAVKYGGTICLPIKTDSPLDNIEIINPEPWVSARFNEYGSLMIKVEPNFRGDRNATVLLKAPSKLFDFIKLGGKTLEIPISQNSGIASFLHINYKVSEIVLDRYGNPIMCRDENWRWKRLEKISNGLELSDKGQIEVSTDGAELLISVDGRGFHLNENMKQQGDSLVSSFYVYGDDMRTPELSRMGVITIRSNDFVKKIDVTQYRLDSYDLRDMIFDNRRKMKWGF